jgi:hypothetical protein
MNMPLSKKGTARRQDSLIRALRPGVGPWRRLITAKADPLLLNESLKRAFRGLHLDPNNAVDWKVLATLLAGHFFDEGRKRGPRLWSELQQLELLWEVQKRKRKNPRLSFETTCEFIANDKDSPSYFHIGSSGLVKQLRKARQQHKDNKLARVANPLAFGRI